MLWVLGLYNFDSSIKMTKTWNPKNFDFEKAVVTEKSQEICYKSIGADHSHFDKRCSFCPFHAPSYFVNTV